MQLDIKVCKYEIFNVSEYFSSWIFDVVIIIFCINEKVYFILKYCEQVFVALNFSLRHDFISGMTALSNVCFTNFPYLQW